MFGGRARRKISFLLKVLRLERRWLCSLRGRGRGLYPLPTGPAPELAGLRKMLVFSPPCWRLPRPRHWEGTVCLWQLVVVVVLGLEVSAVAARSRSRCGQDQAMAVSS